MNFLQSYRINSPTVVSEVFDDEIVVIHLESGSYYSLDQSGAAIWQGVQQGFDLAALSNWLSVTYAVDPDELAQIIPPFINELMQEQLIVPLGAGQPSNGQLPNAPVYAAGIVNSPFARPVLLKFTDMQDLLLLDPIHDVNSSGWPMKKEG